MPDDKYVIRLPPPSEPEKIGEKPHRVTIWLSVSALAISLIAAAFTGLQYWDTREERRKPAPQRVLDRPRLTLKAVSGVKILVSTRSWSLPSGKEEIHPAQFYLDVRLQFKNVGRIVAEVKRAEHRSCIARFILGPDKFRTIEPLAAGCPTEGTQSGAKLPVVLVPNEVLEVIVGSSALDRATIDNLFREEKTIFISGAVSYEDSFHDVMKRRGPCSFFPTARAVFWL